MHNFQVNDMTCGHCASTVEKAVKSVDAAAQVKINTRKVEIQSEKPADAFVAAIGEAGYTGELQV